ncbi:MAG TPA: hypothetical protein VF753_09865 [Terriglobales bacterium]
MVLVLRWAFFYPDTGPYVWRGVVRAVVDGPPPPVPSWTWQYNQNLIGKDQFPARQSDWPIPAQPYRIDQTWTLFPIALTAVTAAAPFAQLDWPLPTRTPEPVRDWIDKTRIQFQVAAAPFAQFDWPNPAQPYRIDQTWTQSFSLPQWVTTGVTLRPPLKGLPEYLPQRSIDQFLFPNIALTAVVTAAPFNQLDWPNPRTPQQPAPSWTWSYNLNLIGKDSLPFRQSDWPNPVRSIESAREWIDRTKLQFITPAPFNQLDWPNPAQPSRLDQTWSARYNLNLIGQDQLPFRQSDWPVPIDYSRQIQTWANTFLLSQFVNTNTILRAPFKGLPEQPVQRPLEFFFPNLALTSVQPNLFAQARQQDWPNPVQPPRLDQTWAAAYNRNLIGQDKLPFLQRDWPLPTQPAQLDQTWVAPYNRNLKPPTPSPTLIVHYSSFSRPDYNDNRVPQ